MIWPLKPRRGPYFQDISNNALPFVRQVEDERMEEGCPAVMLTDPETVEDAIADGMERLLVCTIEFPPEAVHENLMPKGERVMELRGRFDDALPKAFERAKVRARLVGTQTGSGSRQYFLMVEDPRAAEHVLETIAIPDAYARRTEVRDDAEDFAEGWLLPDWFELQAAQDDAVRAKLREHGDDGSGPRDTRFYFYGGQFEQLGEEAANMGFAITPSRGRDGLILSKDVEVTNEALAELHLVFFDWVTRLDVEYDGWETQLRLH